MTNKLIRFISNIECFLENSLDIVFIKNEQSILMHASKGLCNLINVALKDIMGSIDEELPWHNFAALYKERDQNVLQSVQPIEFIEPFPINQSTVLCSKIVKTPIFDENNDVIGILGRIHSLSPTHPFSSALSTVVHIDNKNMALSNCAPKEYQLGTYDPALKLTRREAESLFLLIRGKSAKEIGLLLEISHRTVECHLENIKHKMNVSTRSQIIAKAIEMNMLEIIPKGCLLAHLSLGKLRDI